MYSLEKRETGKSFLVKDLLRHRHIPIEQLFQELNPQIVSTGHMVPSLFIHDAYTPEIVANALKRQKMVVKRLIKKKLLWKK